LETKELILQLATQDEHLTATLLDPSGQALASQPVRLDRAALAQAVRPETYGRALAEAVLAGAIGEALRQAGAARVRLAITGDAGEFHSLRWECLLRQADGRWVPLAAGPVSPFSRLLYPDSTTRARAPQIGWELRVLVAISNPTDLDAYELSAVDVALERAQLQAALKPLQGLVQVEFVDPPVSMDRIFLYLEGEPHIFHFTGHGAFSKRTGRAALFLEDEADRSTQIVNQDGWRTRLASLARPPHLMTLTACESAAQVNAGYLVGMAPALVEAGSGAVVAMGDKVGIEVAREFNYHFYRRLATHGHIDLAVNEARSYLLDRGGWSWSIPTLFMERGAERIFAAPPETLEAEPARSGEVLILIPEFKGHEEAFFEEDLRDKLQEHVAQADLRNVRVVWLRKTVFGPGDEDAVRCLAARYGAALVIWGWYDRARFRACFSVTESLFTYRDPAVFRSSASVRGLLGAENEFALFVNHDLPQQVDYFVFFTLARLYYWAGDYERELSALDRAIAAGGEAGDGPPEGLAYAYFYRGNLYAVYRQDRPAAIADYREALALRPGFADAAFNLGDALRILANTQRHAGEEEAARRTYQAALEAYSQALEIDPDHVPAYERRGLAYYELGLDQAAAEDYRSALDRQPRAEIYHQLGLALRKLKEWDQALAQLDRAIAFAPGTGRYYFSRARIRADAGDEAGAAADFQAYLHLSPIDDQRRERVEAWLAKRGIVGH
jgi:tetratricopeptide (TPR) repeat protein